MDNDPLAAKPRIKITFENEPRRNGSTTAYPPSTHAALETLGEMLHAALRRPSPTTITIAIAPDPSEPADNPLGTT